MGGDLTMEELNQIINTGNLRVHDLFSMPDEPEDAENCPFCGTPISPNGQRCLKCGKVV
jgi:hypothetical protein